ncbi:Uncharacterised protein [Vibrio cholerae]|nr:Uncharacterised protein [Vibrio cholerae]
MHHSPPSLYGLAHGTLGKLSLLALPKQSTAPESVGCFSLSL